MGKSLAMTIGGHNPKLQGLWSMSIETYFPTLNLGGRSTIEFFKQVPLIRFWSIWSRNMPLRIPRLSFSQQER